MQGRPAHSQHPPPRSGARKCWGGQRLGLAARGAATLLVLLATASGAAATESSTAVASVGTPLHLSVAESASGPRIAQLDLVPFPGRFSLQSAPSRTSADGRMRLELAPGRTFALTYRGRFIRSAGAAEVDRQDHTSGLVLRQQLGDHLAASAGFQWTADIRDPDLSLRAASDRLFTELQARMPIFGTTQVRYEFVRTDSFGGGGSGALHRFVVKQEVVVGDVAPDLQLRLLPQVEGGIAADSVAGTAYDFERVALGARLDARSGPSLWAQVGFDWLHYNEGPDSQPGDRSDHVTRLAARLRVPLVDRFSLFTDLSWRQDVSSIADTDSRTLRAGAGLELRF